MTYTWEAGYENILTADELADQAAVQAIRKELAAKSEELAKQLDKLGY